MLTTVSRSQRAGARQPGRARLAPLRFLLPADINLQNVLIQQFYKVNSPTKSST